MKIVLVGLFLGMLCAATVGADDVYMSPTEFVQKALPKATIKPSTYWLTQADKDVAQKIFQHDYSALRVRYWQSEKKTAWILNEVGKVKPITVGIVVNDGAIEVLQVLIYRESHGGEVRYPFFTDQFNALTLKNDTQLSDHIDGIAGATLSVNALTRMSRLALYLHDKVTIDATK